MLTISIQDFVPVLQTAIGPVVLVSGVGLLLLSMTNRLGRAIDRARIIAQEQRLAAPQDRDRLAAQLGILVHRAELIRRAILLASTSLLLAALLVIVLFLSALLRYENTILISMLFIGCMITLVLSLGVFIHDINLSLHALKHEVSDFDGL